MNTIDTMYILCLFMKKMLTVNGHLEMSFWGCGHNPGPKMNLGGMSAPSFLHFNLAIYIKNNLILQNKVIFDCSF